MENNYFEKRLEYLPPEVWSKITQIDQLNKQWICEAQLYPQAIEQLKRSVLITSSGSSARIEGLRLSDEDVEKLMEENNIQKFKDKDEQEIKGYLELLENIFNSWKNIKFSENSIENFHKELLKYREQTTPTCPPLKEIQELIEWTQKNLYENKYHPLLLIANFIIEFLNIHQFTDNDGYLSRILTNLLLLQSGYLYVPYVSYEKLIEDNRSNYYMALRKSQKTFNKKDENIIPWLNFFLTILLKQSQMAVELLSKENIENTPRRTQV